MSADPAALAADAAARTRAVRDLVTPFLVEAGAGSGKTTLLITRILALVAAGVPAHHVAAITFTRKAAGELRERVVGELDATLRGVPPKHPVPWDAGDAAVRARFATALAELDRMYLGTIHGFCARLLRERPVEAGLDPAFEELDEVDALADRRAWWANFLAVRTRAGDARLRALHEAGIDVGRLGDAFAARVAQGDATFPAEWHDAPPVTAELVDALCACVARATDYLRGRGLHSSCGGVFDDWDPLMCAVLELERTLAPELATWRAHGGTGTDFGGTCASGVRWADVIARLLDGDPDADGRFKVLTWTGGARKDADKKEPKEIADLARVACREFGDEFVRVWRAHRYALVMPLLDEAHAAFRAWRLDAGRLTFDDLLQCAERLLREHAGARVELAERFPHLLVDEFQDTDPVQAAVVAFLGADPAYAHERDWRAVRLRALDPARADDPAAVDEALAKGVLVVVGDPKQSIYRFRRADIATWDATHALVARDGAVLPLVRNFRSGTAIRDFVNAAFGHPLGFPRDATRGQAPYAPMVVVPGAGDAPGCVRCLDVPVASERGADSIARIEAPSIARWIRGEIDAGRRTAGDFMILARKKKALGHFVRALAEVGVAAMLGGSEDGPAGSLHELSLVLRLLADPSDRVLTAAVLEGPCFACTPADLFAAYRAGLSPFALATPVPGALRAAAAHDERAARVVEALDVLAAWRETAVQAPPDLLVERILDDRALLLHEAGEPLGDGAAAALLGAVQALRAASFDGRTTLDDAVAALDDYMHSRGGVPTLRPGRSGAVRVMTVHAAKGLEAPVVVLAQPLPERAPAPTTIVRRGEAGAIGALRVVPDRTGTAMAQPGDWDALCDADAALEQAEGVRLRYVAATRAAQELVIAVAVRNGTDAPGQAWSHFVDCGHPLAGTAIPEVEGARVETVDAAPAPVDAATWEAAGRRGWRRTTVTRAAVAALREAREGVDEPASDGAAGDDPARDDAQPSSRTYPDGRPADLDALLWGTLVHRALEAAVRGRRGEALARALRAIVRDHALVADDARTPRPDVVQALDAIVARTMASLDWRDIERATARLAECPVRWMETGEDGTPVLVEGVMDLALDLGDRWLVVDWKTDDGDEASWPAKEEGYRRQLALYAAELARRTGAPVESRLVRVR